MTAILIAFAVGVVLGFVGFLVAGWYAGRQLRHAASAEEYRLSTEDFEALIVMDRIHAVLQQQMNESESATQKETVH